ncbi:MAG: MFS transporter [Candidatus Nanoarchaeia archaeon]|nr:MFS transporter [Candidatus Nanoarchaeia archaeon]
MDKKYKKRVIRTFSLASFLNDLGSDMITPIWPLFVTTFLGASMATLGLIDGLGNALVSISQALSGYISDRIKKRKIFVWLGYLFASFSRVGYAFSTMWQHLIPFKILDRFGKMRDAPRDALIANVSNHKDRGKSFGILEAMDKLGGLCGVIASILLFGLLGYKKLFLVAAVPSLIAVLLIIFIIKEKKSNHIKIYRGIHFKDINNNLRLFLVLGSIFSLGAFSYSFLLVFAKDFGFSVGLVSVLYLIFAAFASVSALPFGKMADKIGRKNVLGLSFVLWILVCLSFIFLNSYVGIILAFVLYGLHRGALDPVQKTFVSELAPENYKASVLGGYQMLLGIVALPASLIAGLLWDKIDFMAPFYFSMGLAVLAFIMLVFVKENKNIK